MMASPDFHHDALRNGVQQGLLLTRGGEQHTYNVICMPGDELFAGDTIDVFGEKWLVMEARADATTHKTGVMQQCNKLFKFQNPGDTTIYERWGYIDISGYSSSFGNNTKLQKGEEQAAVFLPLDAATERIFVDKRLSHFVGYDYDGSRILGVLKVTGVHPHAESFNRGDHLLMLKVVRDLFAPTSDNLELEVCDYTAPDSKPVQPEGIQEVYDGSCVIAGRETVRLGTTCRYKASAPAGMDIEPVWTVSAPMAIKIDAAKDLLIAIPDEDDLIGEIMAITLSDAQSRYAPCSMEVEVVSFG